MLATPVGNQVKCTPRPAPLCSTAGLPLQSKPGGGKASRSPGQLHSGTSSASAINPQSSHTRTLTIVLPPCAVHDFGPALLKDPLGLSPLCSWFPGPRAALQGKRLESHPPRESQKGGVLATTGCELAEASQSACGTTTSASVHPCPLGGPNPEAVRKFLRHGIVAEIPCSVGGGPELSIASLESKPGHWARGSSWQSAKAGTARCAGPP